MWSKGIFFGKSNKNNNNKIIQYNSQDQTNFLSKDLSIKHVIYSVMLHLKDTWVLYCTLFRIHCISRERIRLPSTEVTAMGLLIKVIAEKGTHNNMTGLPQLNFPQEVSNLV